MSRSLHSTFIAISRSENDCGKDILAVCREVAIDSILGWSALLQFLDSAAAVTEYKHNEVVKADMSTAPIFFFPLLGLNRLFIVGTWAAIGLCMDKR